MRFLILTLFWIALPCWTFSQSSSTIDSLINFIAHCAHRDSSYIDALNRLSYEYYVDNPKKLESAYQARILANEINYPKGEAEAYRQMPMVAWGQSNYPLALKHFFEGLQIAEGSHHLQTMADITGNIGLVYQGLGDYSEHLEKTIVERTSALERQNQQLIEYSFINAHKLKAPLARVLGLINLLNITPQEEQKDLTTFLHQASSEFDGITRSINQVVEEGLDAYKKQS